MKIKILTAFFILDHSIRLYRRYFGQAATDMISETDVWSSDKLVDIYLISLYDAIPIGFGRNSYIYEAHMTDESSHPYAGVTIVNNYGAQTLALNTECIPG